MVHPLLLVQFGLLVLHVRPVLTVLKDVLFHGVLIAALERTDLLAHRAQDWGREELIGVRFDERLVRHAHLYGIDDGQ